MFFWNDCASFSTLQLRFREIIALKLQMEAVDNFGTNLSLSAEQNTEALLSSIYLLLTEQSFRSMPTQLS